MKKVLFVSDYTLEEINSVSDMVGLFLQLGVFSNCEKALIKPKTNVFDKFDILKKNKPVKYLELQTPELTNKKPHNLLKFYLYRLLNKLHIKEYDTYYLDYLVRSRKVFKYDFVVFCVYKPRLDVTRWLAKKKIPYIFFLYDTFIGRPGLNANDVYFCEKEIIHKSLAYFVPSFFSGKYFEVYGNEKIRSFFLPLLIDKNMVLSSIKNAENGKEHFDYSYFGALQSFRNETEIFDIFYNLGLKVDVFCYDDYSLHPAVIKHKALKGEDYFLALAKSDFLLVFDNSSPFDYYLPSKVYSYVSFTKPVIVIGKNERSAAKDFFKNYPAYYYHKIGDNIDDLLSFIKKQRSVKFKFNESLYNSFYNYSAQFFLKTTDDFLSSIISTYEDANKGEKR